MLKYFVPFVFGVLGGFVFIPKITAAFLVFYGILAIFTVRIEGINAAIQSIYPRPSDYDKYLHVLKGKTCMVTGCNRGVGLGIAEELALKGANIICANRNGLDTTVSHLKSLVTIKQQNIRAIKVDLSSFQSIYNFAKQLKNENIKIDMLFLNAGMTIWPPKVTSDGFDIMLMVNTISNYIILHYFLKYSLFNLDNNTDNYKSRIIFTSSDSHRWSKYYKIKKEYQYTIINQVQHYAETKLYNQMICNYFVNKLNDKIDVYGVCPGGVASGIAKHAPLIGRILAKGFFNVCFQSIQRAGKHVIYAAIKPRKLLPTGSYFWMMHQPKLSNESTNNDNIKELIGDIQEYLKEFELKYNINI